MTNFNNTINETRNIITATNYIITQDLHNSLESGVLHINNCVSNTDVNKFYILFIKVLNKESKSLVYNYISYPSIFRESFALFIGLRALNNGNAYKEPGNFLSIIDENVLGRVEDALLYSNTSYKINELIDNLSKSYYPISNTQIFALINKLIYSTDVGSMALLTDLALKRDYKGFTSKILSSVNNYNTLVKYLNSDIVDSVSIINGCLYMVKDLENFILNVRNYRYNINTGPQAVRGHINSINNSLSMLDMEYRKSLYNHNNYHISSGIIDNRLRLNRDKFSFNNIHMNIGGVRWYSTTTKNMKNFNRIVDRHETSNTENNVSVINPDTEGIITVVHENAVIPVPDNKKKITVVARMSYNNANTMKQKILKDNKGKAGIYRWIRRDANKSYIGLTVDIKERMSKYFSVKFLQARIEKQQSLIYKALLKYGYSAFRLDILEYCDISVLKEREQYYFNYLEHSYNILQFSRSLKNYRHSPETIEKIKQIVSNRRHVPSPGMKVDIVDTNTKIQTTHESIRLAAKYMNTKHSSVLKRENRLKSRGESITPFIYNYRYAVTIKREGQEYGEN